MIVKEKQESIFAAGASFKSTETIIFVYIGKISMGVIYCAQIPGPHKLYMYKVLIDNSFFLL